MAKKTFSVKCDQIQTGENSSSVRFIVPAPDAPPAKPGERPQRQARTVIQLTDTKPETGEGFRSGKQYKVTIEEA